MVAMSVRTRGFSSLAMGVALAAICGLGACGWETSSGDDGAPVEDVEAATPFPADLIASSWIVHYADGSALGSLTSSGWVNLVNHRHLQKAVEAAAVGPDNELGARAHIEAALLFEQGALIAAHSFIEVYVKTPEPTDPEGVNHLLAVSFALFGNLEAARASSSKLPEGDPTSAFHAPWKAWLAGDAVWPPDLAALPIELPPVAVGVFPTLPPPPHYELPEQGGSGSKRTMGDPGALIALAQWHRSAAKLAGGADMHRAIRTGFGLPVASKVGKPGTLTPKQLFGTTLLTPGDGDFMVELHGEQGIGAVDAHASTSLIAWIAKDARTGGRLDAEKAVLRVSQLRNDLLDASKAKTNGTAEGHHRLFADMGTAGLLWSLALVAEVEGDREVAGLMRLNARDKADLGNHLQDPVSLLSLAAWDAGNRNVHRAPELLHDQARRYPDLEVARYGLDVLALRVQNERIEPSGM